METLVKKFELSEYDQHNMDPEAQAARGALHEKNQALFKDYARELEKALAPIELKHPDVPFVCTLGGDSFKLSVIDFEPSERWRNHGADKPPYYDSFSEFTFALVWQDAGGFSFKKVQRLRVQRGRIRREDAYGRDPKQRRYKVGDSLPAKALSLATSWASQVAASYDKTKAAHAVSTADRDAFDAWRPAVGRLVEDEADVHEMIGEAGRYGCFKLARGGDALVGYIHPDYPTTLFTLGFETLSNGDYEILVGVGAKVENGYNDTFVGQYSSDKLNERLSAGWKLKTTADLDRMPELARLFHERLDAVRAVVAAEERFEVARTKEDA
jgi:hypothetical protein